MQKDSQIKVVQLNADGGMSNNQLAMQMQADLLGAHVALPSDHETTGM